jgi:hypothetical protein
VVAPLPSTSFWAHTKAVELVETAIEETLAYCAFAEEHWRQNDYNPRHYVQAIISALIRATVELLKPTCLATLLMPIPWPSACLALST